MKDLILRKIQYKESGLKLKEKAMKILMNSGYGGFGNAYFEYQDPRVAELITAFGQHTLKSLEIIALHVIDRSSLGAAGDLLGYYRGGNTEEYEKEMKEVGEGLLAEVEDVIKKYGNINVRREVIIDTSNANGIITYAENKKVDLILIGAKGTSGLEKFMLGGVVSKVINLAHCPVVAIR